MWSWTLISSVLALAATVMQARSSLRELAERDPEIGSALAIDEWTREVPWWRLLRRSRQRRIVADLKRESPVEAAAYRRVWSAVMAWSLLGASVFVTAVGSVVAPFVEA
jgi:hypothetical protein